jgi:hypothetical protein
MNKRKSLEKIEENKKKKNINSNCPNEEIKELAENNKTRLERLIPEFYVNQKTLSDVSMEEQSKEKEDLETSSDLSELREDEKINLFNRLKTKNKFYKINNNNNNYNNNNNLSLPLINYSINNYNNNNNSINYANGNLSQIFLERKFDENEIRNAAASKLFQTQNKSNNLVDNNNNIINIKKLKTKLEIINNNPKDKKENVIGIDLFKYDKNKWEKKNLREVYK